MTVEILHSSFEHALTFEDYLNTGTDEQRRRWQQVYDAVQISDNQRALLAGFTRQMRVLTVSGIWCGDCVQQCPLVQRLAEANASKVMIRYVDRDLHKQLSSQLRINGGHRVPVVLFLAEDYELCSVIGDRTLNRYRAIAQRQLGPSCPTGIGKPDTEVLNATLADWADEFERIQLMLRLSPRLRQKYGD